MSLKRRDPPSGKAPLGTAAMLVGAVMLLWLLAARASPSTLPVPRMLLRNPTVWFGLSVLLILGGVRVVWTTTEKVTAWQPEIPGRRFRAARLYTHGDCPLCTETQELLTNYAHVLPPIETLDVEADPHLRERFGACTPVLELDNRVRFRGGISEILLRRLIEGTPPVVESP